MDATRPRFGSGRQRAAVLGSLVAMYATAPGQTFVLSQFNDALCASRDAAVPGLGLTPTSLAGSYLVGTLLSAASLTHAGRVADRLGPRRMIAIAACGLGLAGLGLSMVHGIVALALAFFALRFFGQGVLTLASSHALALRFDARLGSVEGLRGATVSLAIATTPLAATLLIGEFGWRTAARILCAGSAVLGVVAAYGLLDPDPPRETPREADDGPRTGGAGPSFTLRSARRTLPFWTLIACTAFTATLLTAVHFHLQPILGARGIGKTEAASTFVPFAVAGLLATLVGGVLVDRLRPRAILAPAVALLGIGAASVGHAEGFSAAAAGMAILGTGHGLTMAVSAPTLARYFGRAHHGAIRGAAGTAAVAGSAAGPYALSAAAVPLDGFERALDCASAFAIPLLVLALRLRTPDRA